MRDIKTTELFFPWGMVLIYVFLNACGAIIIKYKVNQLGKIDIGSMKNAIRYFSILFSSPLVLSGFLAIFGSAIAWIAALSRLEISAAYPVAVGLNFFFVVLVAILFFGESFNVSRILGIILIFISIYLLSRP